MTPQALTIADVALLNQPRHRRQSAGPLLTVTACPSGRKETEGRFATLPARFRDALAEVAPLGLLPCEAAVVEVDGQAYRIEADANL